MNHRSRIDDIYLMKGISLEELFSNNEIDEILKESCFWSAESEEEQNTSDNTRLKGLSRFKKHSMKFDRGTLVMKFLSIAIEKLKDSNKVVSKALNWVKTEIQDTLVMSDIGIIKRGANDEKQLDVDLNNIMGWIGETHNYNQSPEKSLLQKMKMPPKGKQKAGQTNSAERQRNSVSHFPTTTHKKNSSNQIHYKPEAVIQNNYNEFVNSLEEAKKATSVFKKQNTTLSEKYFFIDHADSSDKPTLINEDILESINSTNFDIFKYEKEVGRDATLPSLVFQTFFHFDLYTIITIDAMENFVEQIKNGYIKSNPYHHDLHAADVLQTCYSMMIHSNIREVLYVEYLDLCSFFIAALIHDYKHPGLTNGFLIMTKNKLAIEYNDLSVLENYHVSEAFKIILDNKDCNIFSMLTTSEFKTTRKKIIDCVLATDMTKHAHEYHYVKMKVETYQIKNGVNSNLMLLNLEENARNQTKQEFFNTLMHLADISNPTKPLCVYKKWADLVMSEFWCQGDKEKNLGLPVSFLCDRSTTSLSAAQVGFMDGIVLPLTQIVVEIFPGLHYMIENILINSAHYKKLKEESR